MWFLGDAGSSELGNVTYLGDYSVLAAGIGGLLLD